MKIIYIHQYFNFPEEAGSTRSWEIARRWVRDGHEVEMITSDHRGNGARSPRSVKRNGQKGWRVEEREGVRIHRTWIPYNNRMSAIGRINAWLQFAWRSAQRIRALEADCIYASSTPLTVALPAIFGSRRKRIPMVFEVRDLWPAIPIAMGELSLKPLQWAAKALERAAYRHASAVIALSPGMKRGVESVTSSFKRQPPVSVVPNGSDRELFQREMSPFNEPCSDIVNEWEDRELVLYCGTFGRVNGLKAMVQIAEKMKTVNPAIAFLLVGEGREKEELRKLAQENGTWNQNLFMKDPVPKELVPGLYQHASLSASFVMDNPALWENSANKFFDSLAAGKPILLNHEGWLADLVREHGIGLVVPPDDPEQGAEEIARFLGDPERVKDAGHAALELARTTFDRERLFRDIDDVVSEAHV